MRRLFLGAALSLLASGYAGSALSGMSHAQLGDAGLDAKRHRPRPKGKGRNNRRGTGTQAKAAKRPNRLTIGKRVRRKHRRARS